jgi:diguanylate cyclase (GGDEF)-like protein/putative nucleotidyltransferase with HDIG domain
MPFSQIFFWTVPIIALASYVLLMFFFAVSQKDKLIKMFMWVLAALILWTASSLFMKLQLYPGTLFWNRLMVSGTIAFPFLLYCFVSVFTNSVNIISTVIWGALAFVAFIINISGYVITEAQVITNTVLVNGRPVTIVEFGYTLGTWAFPIFGLMFMMILNIILKARKGIQKGNTTHGQISLIVAGVSIMFIGSFLNVFPSIGKYPVDILACFINAILIVVAIFKYRMLELRFMVTKGFVYSMLALLITGLYVLTVFYVEKRMTPIANNIVPYFTIFLALLVAILFQPLYRSTGRLVDKMFYKADYSRRQALRNFSLKISNNLDLDEIAKELIEAVQQAIHAKDIIVLIKNEEKGYYYVYRTSSQLFKPNFQISAENPIIKWFLNNDASLTRAELYSIPFFKSMWEKEKKEIYELDIEVITPIRSGQDLIGMLMLTRKKNSTAYMLDDLDLLTYLGTSSAVAIDNARLFARAQSEAMTDSLTKLYNHRYFYKAMAEYMEKIGGAELSLLMIDLDMFKLFNDLYGHYEGDNALQTVAAIMTRIVENKGIVCRYGGEEFTVLLPYYDSKRAFEIAEKIRLEIQKSFINSNDVTKRFLTASIGICTYPHAAPNAEELLKRADWAMYMAKSSGKNQTVIYTPNIDSSQIAPYDSIHNHGIKPAYTATIYALTAAIDAKDHYTFGHSQRVAEYAATLAKAVGLDHTHLQIIREAALLHDIGKIGIPENILTKTGRLTDEEYAIIKGHVEMSITIIKHLPSMNHVIPAVIGHHERWDGTGYPRGLKGESIPFLARCLAITDTFDAMTSDRPYRGRLSLSVALKEIENGIGKQFDPEIAKLFLKLVSEGTIRLIDSVKIGRVV